MIGHSIQRRARTPAVAFAWWNVLGPYPTRTRAAIRNNCVRRAVESHEIVHKEPAVPDDNKEVGHRRGDRRVGAVQDTSGGDDEQRHGG